MRNAGINIDPWMVAACRLRGHGTTLNGVCTRHAARMLGLLEEACREVEGMHPYYPWNPSSPRLVAAIGRELVRRITGR